jgi:hypothetical protein
MITSTTKWKPIILSRIILAFRQHFIPQIKATNYKCIPHLIIFLLFVMLVDPRPYTYEYRKPRYSNPTLYFPFHLANPKTYTTVSTTAAPLPKSMTTSPKATDAPSIAITHRSRIAATTLNNRPKINETPNAMMQDSSCHPWAKIKEQECHRTSEAWTLRSIALKQSPNEERASSDSEFIKGSNSHTTSSAATPSRKTITSFAASPNSPSKTSYWNVGPITTSRMKSFDCRIFA